MSLALTEAESGSIFAGLESPEEELRRIAVEQLRLLPVCEAVPRLVERLGDESWRVRKAAVEGLVSCREDPSVQDQLVESLADGDNSGRRNSAFEVLVACGSYVTLRLVRELSNRDPDVRKLVVDALAAIGDPSSTAALRERLEDSDPNVRAAVAEALGAAGGRKESAHLLRVAIAPDEDVLVRLSALRALTQLEASPHVADLGETLEDPMLRAAAFELLAHSEDPAAVEVLVKGLGSHRVSSREAAMGGLLKMLARRDGLEADELRSRLRVVAAADDRLVESACARLEAADLAHRMILIQFLGLLDDLRVVLPILAAGRDEALTGISQGTLEALGPVFPSVLEAAWGELDFDSKQRACRGLGRTGGDRAEHLLARALAEPDPELRCAAASALGRGACIDRAPELVMGLEAAAQDDEPEARDEVAVFVAALVEMAEGEEGTGAGAELIDLLTARVAGASEPIRLAIARVLALIARPRDEQIVCDLLGDESPVVRRAAVTALSRFDFERVEESLRLALVDESGSVRIAAARALGESGRVEAVEDLRPLMMDDDPSVVAVTLRAVGQLHRGIGSAPDEIYALLQSAFGFAPIVALAACEALADVGGERAGELAAEVLGRSEPEIVRAAIACVAAHGSSQDLMALTDLVSHPDWSVRAEAIEVLDVRGVRGSLPVLLLRLEAEQDEFVREILLRATCRLEG